MASVPCSGSCWSRPRPPKRRRTLPSSSTPARKTFRNAIYDKYKAHRPPPPEELVPQFSLIRDAVKAFNVACIEHDGYEADDLIATYAREAVERGGDVTIVSSDKDLMQLVRPGVAMLDTMKNKRIGREEVFEKFGVAPDKVVDVQALAGDSTDNVPGVPGIGVKTAAELITEYGDLDGLLAQAGAIKQPKRREKLIEFAEQARISRELVRLKQDVPLDVGIERIGVQDPVGADAARLPAAHGILDAHETHCRKARRGSAGAAGEVCRLVAAEAGAIIGRRRRFAPAAILVWCRHASRRRGGNAGAHQGPFRAIAPGTRPSPRSKVSRSGSRPAARRDALLSNWN